MPLFVSYSSMNSFRKCPRYYWWKHIRRLEKPEFKIPFIVGRIMHHGIQTLFSKPEIAEKETLKAFKAEVVKARKEFPLIDMRQEEELVQQECITTGMVKAFKYRFSKFLSQTKHIATEKSLVYPLNKQVTIVGKIDNILQNQGKRYVYELKNLKSLDRARVEGIKTDPQTGLYVEVHNRITKKKTDWVSGIIYKIIRKPQIRQKKNESKGQFLKRLQDWYMESDGDIKMHLERLNKPFIDGASVLNTVDKVTQQMLQCKTKEDYYQDFSACIRDWGRCSMYELCHEGETPANLKLYRPRPKFQVEPDNAVEEDV